MKWLKNIIKKLNLLHLLICLNLFLWGIMIGGMLHNYIDNKIPNIQKSEIGKQDSVIITYDTVLNKTKDSITIIWKTNK